MSIDDLDQKRSRRYGEHIQQKRKRKNESNRKLKIRKAIELGNEALAEEEYYRAACLARDKIAPLLLRDGSLREYDRTFNGEDEWHVSSLSRFLEGPDKYAAILANGHSDRATDEFALRASGFKTPKRAAREVVTEAFVSLETIAIEEGIVKGEMRNYVTARAYTTQVGKMWKAPDMHIEDPVRVISRDSGLTKTLYHGGTGQGKSSTAGTDIYDRYNINHPDRNRAYFVQRGHDRKIAQSLSEGAKIIDLLDLTEGENMVYDIPQQHEDLKKIRQDEGLPPTFEDSDELLEPELEILVPLTPSLNEKEMPYDTDEGEFVPTPFTIPASDLSKPLLVSLLASMVTGQQETTIRTAYDDVARDIDDWSLRDLAEEIMSRDDLGDSYKKRVVKLLDNLQNMGFIRTEETAADTNLDWERIFNDTDTITSFSTAFMDDEVGKFIVVGYLIDRIDDLREVSDWPDLTIVAKELHNLAPHRNETSYDARAEALQEAIGRRLSTLMRENRHRALSVIADTQDVLNLKKGFRKQFNRFVTFNTSDENLQELFSYTSTDNWKSCSRSLTKRKGEGAVIGQAKPLVEREDLDYLGHVAFVPPPHHHLDTDSEPAGWIARTMYLDNEELRQPNIDVHVPEQLLIDERELDNDAVARTPTEEFINECLVVTANHGDWEHTNAVRAAYSAWANANDKPQMSSATQFGKKFNAHVGDSIDKAWRNGGNAYLGIRFNSTGKDFSGVN